MKDIDSDFNGPHEISDFIEMFEKMGMKRNKITKVVVTLDMEVEGKDSWAVPMRYIGHEPFISIEEIEDKKYLILKFRVN